jgi:hypothetical protein
VSDFVSGSRAVITKARGQFGNLEDGEGPPLEAFTRRLVETQPAEKL